MRVLWVTNIPLNAANRMLQRPATPYGGWLQGALGALAGETDIQIVVASPGSNSVRNLGTEAGVQFTMFPAITRRGANRDGRKIAADIIAAHKPDVVHIHGTEMPHSFSFAAECSDHSRPAVVSIQGLVSVYARHQRAFLPPSVVHGLSSRPWVRSDRVIGMERSFEVQGRLERRTLQLVPHVIGRTTWDFACTGEINPHRRYHHCDETLRPVFYQNRWRWPGDGEHSILVGQGHYPIKGLHLLIQALPAVLARFPKAVITVAGQSPVAAGQRTPYSRYISRLLDKFQLRDHVRFVGQQTEVQMVAHYLASHVLVCPSTIENSPNSVAEAMILGMPVVASNVGGVPDMVRHSTDGLTYQADAPYMLANAITTMFDSPEVAVAMGNNARERAMDRHDPRRNASRTAAIYSCVLGGDESC